MPFALRHIYMDGGAILRKMTPVFLEGSYYFHGLSCRGHASVLWIWPINSPNCLVFDMIDLRMGLGGNGMFTMVNHGN